MKRFFLGGLAALAMLAGTMASAAMIDPPGVELQIEIQAPDIDFEPVPHVQAAPEMVAYAVPGVVPRLNSRARAGAPVSASLSPVQTPAAPRLYHLRV